jgi:hypothetical protein
MKVLPSRSSNMAPSPLAITQGALQPTPLGMAFFLLAMTSADFGPGSAVMILGNAFLNIVYILLNFMKTIQFFYVHLIYVTSFMPKKQGLQIFLLYLRTLKFERL